jgi:membrane-bound ClpP family serine protease
MSLAAVIRGIERICPPTPLRCHERGTLVLSTLGGDPHAAYRIARFLKYCYKRFYLYVFGYCKSAGTIIALGADEIIMSVRGELGPLDVQMIKPDEFTERSSGLDISIALEEVASRAFGTFEGHFWI